MRTFEKVMEKWAFVELISEILKEPLINYENKEFRLKLSDFKGWDDWFGFGEWDDGAHTISCTVADNNKHGIGFLRGRGFI